MVIQTRVWKDFWLIEEWVLHGIMREQWWLQWSLLNNVAFVTTLSLRNENEGMNILDFFILFFS